MANTFVLSGSGSGRDSRYRSGGSTLTRTDSATLPKSEFVSVSNVNTNSWSSGGSVQFSPGSGIPPVPGNAEKVYVPPQTQRASVERSMQRSAKESEPEHKLHTPPTHSDTPSLASTIALALSERLPISHTPLDTPSPSSAPASSPLSSAPSSARDLDHVLDYYSFADTPTPTPPDSDEQHVFRPPFSPIIEESASQLSPPTPYERERDAAALGARSPESVQSAISPSSLSSATGGKRNVPPESVTNSIISVSITPTPPSLSPPLAFPGSSNPSTSNSMSSRKGKQNPTLTMTPPRRPRPQNRSGSAPVPSPIKVVRNVGMYSQMSHGHGQQGAVNGPRRRTRPPFPVGPRKPIATREHAAASTDATATPTALAPAITTTTTTTITAPTRPGVSTEFSTPNSDMRALQRAQDELYDMLGIPIHEGSRRSRSVIGLPRDSEPQQIRGDVPPSLQAHLHRQIPIL
ncbi:hypothetical protein J132_01188 [Termitomyces sp. J132]|nr:hypothetical protein J132_01188 [Termitomyces sp. J132]